MSGISSVFRNSETGALYGVRPYYLFVENTGLDMGIHQVKVHKLGADIGIVFRKSSPCIGEVTLKKEKKEREREKERERNQVSKANH